jgi:hypothetical protein
MKRASYILREPVRERHANKRGLHKACYLFSCHHQHVHLHISEYYTGFFCIVGLHSTKLMLSALVKLTNYDEPW